MKNPVGRPKDLEKQKDIIYSARTLFLELGYDNCSMEKIAKRAKVSKITIYNHFHDKETLFTHIIQQVCDEFIKADCWQLHENSNFRQELYQCCLCVLDVIYLPESIKLEYLLLKLASEKNPLLQPFFQESHAKVQQLWQNFLQQAIEFNFIQLTNEQQPQALSFIASLICDYRYHQVLLGQMTVPNSIEKQQIAQTVTDIFCLIYQK